jgi:hypothetical protein
MFKLLDNKLNSRSEIPGPDEVTCLYPGIPISNPLMPNDL